MLLPLASLPVVVFILLRVCGLIRNYRIARKIGLPIILLPASFEDPWWNVLRPLLPWVEHLPFGIGYWYFYTDLGWPMRDGTKTTYQLGENFILVSPTCNQIVTSYPPAVDAIFKDHRRWIRPEAFGQLLAIYGQNLISTNGTEWQRHRKITGSAFNEITMRRVWEKAGQTSITALEYTDKPEQNMTDMRAGLEVLALGVLTAVAFDQDTNLSKISSGHRQTLIECLSLILKNVFVSIALVKIKVPDKLLPKFVQRLKVSISEFRIYMEEAVLRQKQLSASDYQGSRGKSLLEAMIIANEVNRQDLELQSSHGKSTKSSHLTDSELYGNLFIFNLAGFETTAGTMTFALPYLAAYPDVQDWVTQEVDASYTTSKDNSYEEVYPKLVRCLALMYETLRVASTAPQLVRAPVIDQPLPVVLSKGIGSVIVPAGTIVSVHVDAVHYSPRWGPDVEEFNPKRFITSTRNDEDEAFVIPTDCMHIAWVLGPRLCPGKKFSQVEFVAVIAHILFLYRIEVVRKTNESENEARTRLRYLLRDKYFNGSAHLRRPDDAQIRFVPRR